MDIYAFSEKSYTNQCTRFESGITNGAASKCILADVNKMLDNRFVYVHPQVRKKLLAEYERIKEQQNNGIERCNSFLLQKYGLTAGADSEAYSIYGATLTVDLSSVAPLLCNISGLDVSAMRQLVTSDFNDLNITFAECAEMLDASDLSFDRYSIYSSSEQLKERFEAFKKRYSKLRAYVLYAMSRYFEDKHTCAYIKYIDDTYAIFILNIHEVDTEFNIFYKGKSIKLDTEVVSLCSGNKGVLLSL